MFCCLFGVSNYKQHAQQSWTLVKAENVTVAGICLMFSRQVWLLEVLINLAISRWPCLYEVSYQKRGIEMQKLEVRIAQMHKTKVSALTWGT